MTRVVLNSPLARRAKVTLHDPSPVFAISGPGIIWVDGPTLPEDLRVHEEIHQQQFRRWGYVLYPLRYGGEMALRLAQYRNARQAYLAHSLERQAYAAPNAYRAARGLPPVGLA